MWVPFPECWSSWNVSFYRNEEVDRLLDQAQRQSTGERPGCPASGSNPGGGCTGVYVPLHQNIPKPYARTNDQYHGRSVTPLTPCLVEQRASGMTEVRYVGDRTTGGIGKSTVSSMLRELEP